MKKILIVWLVVMVASLIAGEKNLIELHKNAGKLTDKDCLVCHFKIRKETSLNMRFKTFHRVHLESKLETPKSCADCHESIDLREGSASALRKQVDPELCAVCHSGDVESAKKLFVR